MDSILKNLRQPEIDSVVDLFKNKLGIDLNGKIVLDVGCSKGFHASGMRKLGADAWVNDTEINKLVEDFTARKIPGKIENAPSEYYGKFDLITAFRVFLPAGNLIDFHKGIAACLKEGGKVIIASDIGEEEHKEALEKLFKNVKLLNFKKGAEETSIQIGNTFFFEASEPRKKIKQQNFRLDSNDSKKVVTIFDTLENFLSINEDSKNRWSDVASGNFVVGKTKIKKISSLLQEKSNLHDIYNQYESFLLHSTASELKGSDLNLLTSVGIKKIIVDNSNNVLSSNKFKDFKRDLFLEIESNYINQFFETENYKNSMSIIQEFRNNNIEYNYVVNKLLAGEKLSEQEHNNFNNLTNGEKIKDLTTSIYNEIESIKKANKPEIESEFNNRINEMTKNIFNSVNDILNTFGLSKTNNLTK